MKGKIYIAYGSNMDEEQMRYRCPDAKLIGTGILAGWRLMFKGSKTGAYATIEKEKGLIVPVLFWRISEADEARLDRYEGFPTFYYKRTIQAVKLDAQGSPCGRTRGMAYVMHEDRKHGIPSHNYLDVLYSAYRRFGFDTGILDGAYEYSRQRAESPMWERASIEVDGKTVQYAVHCHEKGAGHGLGGGRIFKLDCRADGDRIIYYERGWITRPQTEFARKVYGIMLKMFDSDCIHTE